MAWNLIGGHSDTDRINQSASELERWLDSGEAIDDWELMAENLAALEKAIADEASSEEVAV